MQQIFQLEYGDVAFKADRFTEDSSIERGETTDLTTEASVETNRDVDNDTIEKYLAGFLHRRDTLSAPVNCTQRVRLTPSGPSKKGSMWFHSEINVNNGFDTYFTFQITDHSKECTTHRDQYFSQMHHTTCSVRGGDGFAFVVQRDPDGINALGQDGGQMGFGGIENSLAVAFDTWPNPGFDQLGVDHVSFQASGRGASNDALEPGLLGIPRPHSIADGVVHLARIVYFSDLQAKYLKYLVASDSVLQYLLDNGEQKRIGTLVVFMDEGIAKDTPLMAMPINLSLLLDLPTDKAYVGFTSSTGRFYEKHDILSWYFCDEEPCVEKDAATFDYHQTSKFFSNAALRMAPEGPGYGTSGTSDSFPTFHTSPDTSAWEVPLQHFSKSRNHGLTPDAGMQVPPNTLFR
jgi:hypothetical protein